MPSDFEHDFKKMIHDQRDKIKARIVAEEPVDAGLDNLNLDWIGTRSEVELPQSKDMTLQKDIVPEMINQKFMWVDDYFHYSDWEVAQKEVFDSFNLLVVPRKEGDFKYFYDRSNHQRIVPQGIFPPPNHKRVLLTPHVYKFPKELSDNTN